MDISKESNTLIETRKNVLLEAAITLKTEFVGIDTIIDTILKSVTPWYLYPAMQKRPTIINLWGMTGVGKTSVVKRLVELLSFQKQFYHFDMGATSEKNTSLKMFFRELIITDEPFPFILALDEFQYARTLKGGDEYENAYSRVIWELFDTGKFQVFRDQNCSDILSDAIMELRFLLERGVTVDKGYVTDNIGYYLSVTTDKEGWKPVVRDRVNIFNDEDEFDEFMIPDLKNNSSLRFVKKEVINTIMMLADDLFEHTIVLKDKLLSLDGEGSVAFLESIMNISVAVEMLTVQRP